MIPSKHLRELIEDEGYRLKRSRGGYHVYQDCNGDGRIVVSDGPSDYVVAEDILRQLDFDQARIDALLAGYSSD